MVTSDDRSHTSRRALLGSIGATVGMVGIGSATGRSTADGPSAVETRTSKYHGSDDCPDATVRPRTIPYQPPEPAACSDDHPATRELRDAVQEALDGDYPTVGSLLDAGYLPYGDLATAEGGAAWSHWLNPEYVGDGEVMDPARPEAVMVDHRWWRPLGVMFVATEDGRELDPPPAVYTDPDDGTVCAPWHAHVGLPGRAAWWTYRTVRGDADGRRPLPCRTPWMLHVWTYPNPGGVYAHEAPPPRFRGGPPATPAGFETDAVPGQDPLDEQVLDDVLRHWARDWR